MEKEPQWGSDQVVGLMVNQAQKIEYVDSCGEEAPMMILQDNDQGGMWTGLGGKYNSILIVDQVGVVQHFIYPSSFPGSVEEIVDVVEELLQ